MTHRFEDQTQIEPGDEPIALRNGRCRWTFGRVMTDLGIIMVAVPVGLNALAPPWPRGGCGMTDDFVVFSMGLVILVVRLCWLILKAFNEAGIRALDRLFSSQALTRKPKPLDDF